MEKLKNIILIILEGILFGGFGGLFLYLSLLLFHYLTFKPPSGNINFNVTPFYKMIVFPTIILLLSISFIFGKGILKLLKEQNLQWFYNLIFFIVTLTYTHVSTTYQYLSQNNYEMSFENFVLMGYLGLFIIVFLFLLLYSFLYQIIKTRLLFEPKTIC
jgi:hypothetical protein